MLEEDEDKLRVADELKNGFEATVSGGVPMIVCKACDKAVASSTTAVAAKSAKPDILGSWAEPDIYIYIPIYIYILGSWAEHDILGFWDDI